MADGANWRVGAVSAVSAIAVAAITTWGTIQARGGSLEEATDAAQAATSRAEELTTQLAGEVPVGTVVASLMDPATFASEVGDRAVFDPQRSRWAPADGQVNVRASQYGAATSAEVLPDMRGMFLRGLNVFDASRGSRGDEYADPDMRSVGSPQRDAFHGHHHGLSDGNNVLRNNTQNEVRNGTGTWGSDSLREGDPTADGTNGRPRTAPESRPVNVAVYYYVRVNK